MTKRGRPSKRAKQLNITGLRNQKPATRESSLNPASNNDDDSNGDDVFVPIFDSARVDWEKEEDDDSDDDIADDSDDLFDDTAFAECLAEMAAREDDKHDEWLPKIKKERKPTGECKCNIVSVLTKTRFQ
jgi:hypothetical protein